MPDMSVGEAQLPVPLRPSPALWLFGDVVLAKLCFSVRGQECEVREGLLFAVPEVFGGGQSASVQVQLQGRQGEVSMRGLQGTTL